ncbi:hypothetical protein SCOR_07710 [Sulfidibacter corallicola]|uniref:Uncharacterized protein n=1 Tax=Sulfidibacter corallicola TaxID=2818388 RepID=A0A8A4TQW7_SULCO|nr:hypothetical protein [Sulfidibacter corallicola]QTD51351.1 hypothetical protein J3U87_02685 [Sulfidibacter corallicola]
MANTSVYTGADGSITLSVPSGAEGEAADAIINENELISVGRATGVRVEVHTDLKAFHELGQRFPTQLRPGNVSISGSIGRAFINGALLKLLLGEGANSRPAGAFIQPAFNITLLLANPATDGVQNTVTLHDVKLANWVYEIPEDQFVMEKVGFMAASLTVQDEG